MQECKLSLAMTQAARSLSDRQYMLWVFGTVCIVGPNRICGVRRILFSQQKRWPSLSMGVSGTGALFITQHQERTRRGGATRSSAHACETHTQMMFWLKRGGPCSESGNTKTLLKVHGVYTRP